MISFPILDKTVKTVLISNPLFPLWLEHEVNQHFGWPKYFDLLLLFAYKNHWSLSEGVEELGYFLLLGEGMNLQGLEQELALAFPTLWFTLFLGFIVNCCTGLE